MNRDELAHLACKPRKGEKALAGADLTRLIEAIPEWELSGDEKAISRDFEFPDFHHTLGFLNAVGFIANTQDHHPDVEAGYGHCRLTFSTHDVGGLSMNDFILAARVEALLR